MGVASDVHHLSVEESSGPEFYLPILHYQNPEFVLDVRANRPFGSAAPGLRRAIAEVTPDLPTAAFQPLAQNVDRALSSRKFFVGLLAAFAAVALFLSAIGIYGFVAFSVAQRTAEIGIRMALGASAGNVLTGVVGDTLRLSLIGVAAGLAGATLFSSWIASLLYDVSPSDPETFAAAAAMLLGVATAAGLIPAARAARISPTSALRAG